MQEQDYQQPDVQQQYNQQYSQYGQNQYNQGYPQNYPQGYPQNPQYYPQQYNTPQYVPTSGMCIAGFVCSLVLTGVLGLIFSIIGIKECNEKGMGGKGLGTAGLIISIIKLCILVLWIIGFGCMCSSLLPYRWR